MRLHDFKEQGKSFREIERSKEIGLIVDTISGSAENRQSAVETAVN